MFDKVAEFHTAFEQTIATSPAFPTQDVRNLRVKILAEEVQEYFDAETDNDLLEITDAIADCLYVIAGTALSYGLVKSTDIYDLHRNSTYAPALPPLHVRAGFQDKLKAKWGKYLITESSVHATVFDVRSALWDMIETLLDVTIGYEIPIAEIFDEVHRSNMTKLEDGKPVKRNDGKIIKGPNFEPATPGLIRILESYGAKL